MKKSSTSLLLRLFAWAYDVRDMQDMANVCNLVKGFAFLPLAIGYRIAVNIMVFLATKNAWMGLLFTAVMSCFGSVAILCAMDIAIGGFDGFSVISTLTFSWEMPLVAVAMVLLIFFMVILRNGGAVARMDVLQLKGTGSFRTFFVLGSTLDSVLQTNTFIDRASLSGDESFIWKLADSVTPTSRRVMLVFYALTLIVPVAMAFYLVVVTATDYFGVSVWYGILAAIFLFIGMGVIFGIYSSRMSWKKPFWHLKRYLKEKTCEIIPILD